MAIRVPLLRFKYPCPPDPTLSTALPAALVTINVPPLTADRRKEMAKLVSKLGEEGKVAVRNVRKIAMKTVDAMLKDKVISEDRKKTLDKSIQALTDESVKKVEGMVKAKQEEITKV